MKIKRLAALMAVLLLVIGVFAGCKEDGGGDEPVIKTDIFEPTRSCLYIRDNGTAAGAEITPFAEDYYSLSELKEYVEGLVIQYNQDKAGLAYAYAKDVQDGSKLPVAISKLTEENGNAVLILECATPADYISINDLNVSSDGLKAVTTSTVEQMKAAGKTIKADLVDTKGNAVSVDKAMNKDTYHVVVCEGAVVLQVQGKVMYMSSNVTYVNSETVETPAGEVSYIIYK